MSIYIAMACKRFLDHRLITLVIFATLMILNVSASEPGVPAMYVFGDSTADVGTNNYLPECGAKANILHHGIDFPGSKPTGRFSNGYNSVDYIAQFLGFKESPPPYLLLAKNENRGFVRNVLKGANFASGGSGILDITGKRPYKRVVSLSEQVKQFSIVRNVAAKVLGDAKAQERIASSLFIISVGSNDIFEHFLYDKIPPKGDTFINNLISTYESRIRGLIRLGAKRMALVGVSPIGCVPALRAQVKGGACSEPMNAYAKQFNVGLEVLFKKLTSEGLKPIMKYSFAKPFDMTLNVISNPAKYGFKDGKTACCGNGKNLNAELPCNPSSKVCNDRETHLFWDQFHPTQTAYKFVAYALYFGGNQHVSPFNISQLIHLKF